MNTNLNAKRIIGVETGELTERQLNRLDLLRRYKQNERSVGNYEVDEGIYDVEVNQVLLKSNSNKNDFIEFVCKNLGNIGPKTLYGIYYLTDGADASSLTDLRCLLSEYDQDDFTDEQIVDDCAILEKLQVLVQENAKLVVENQNGFMSSKLYKEIPSV